MRTIHASWLIPALALTACAEAGAATVDPNNDFDCATTAASYRDLAERSGAPSSQQHALFVLNQWFAAKWQDQHSGSGEETTAKALPIVNAIAADPAKYKDVLLSCTDRASSDPKFNRFAKLLR